MQKPNRLAHATRLIAAFTFLSRILGLAREVTYSHYFGTGPLLSSFRIAFMVPNLARRLFGEGALSAAFIPVFTQSLNQDDPAPAKNLAGATFTLLATVLLAIVVLGEIGLFIARALHPSDTLRMTAVMLPFLGLICLTAFLGGILNALNRFAAPAASPALLNVCVITTIVAAATIFKWNATRLADAACVAVLVAGVAQLALQIIALRSAGFIPTLNLQWKTPQIGEISRLMLPMMLGLSAVQLNTMFDKLIALFFVPDGRGPAVLGFAHFLYQLPLGVFGIALATAVFPTLAKHAADDRHDRLADTIERGVSLGLFIALPATAGLIIIAQPLVQVLFQHGRFGPDGTQRVATTLVWYASGLTAFTVQHILVRAFYAAKKPKTPVRIAAAVVALNLLLNLILVRSMGEAGVALATAVTALVQVVWTAAKLHTYVVRLDLARIARSAARSALATTAMLPAVWFAANRLSPLPVAHWPAWARVALAVTAGTAAFALAARILRCPELSDLFSKDRPHANTHPDPRDDA